MGITSRWLWAALIALAVASGVSLRGSAGSEGRTADAGQRFVRIGDYYLNASRIDYAFGEGDGLLVVFGSEAANWLKLAGSDAETMRRWLDRQSSAQENLRSQRGDSSTRRSPPDGQSRPGAPPHSGGYPQGGPSPSINRNPGASLEDRS